MPVIVDDLGHAIMHIAGDGLALAENLARHGIERVVVHAHERTAKQIDAVEHQTAGDVRLTAAEIALGFADAHRARSRPRREWMAHTRSNPLQYREIEVDDVPAREHIRIESTRTRSQNAFQRRVRSSAQRVARSGIGRSLPSTISTSSTSGAYREIASSRSALRVGFDVEGQHARLDRHLGGS